MVHESLLKNIRKIGTEAENRFQQTLLTLCLKIQHLKYRRRDSLAAAKCKWGKLNFNAQGWRFRFITVLPEQSRELSGSRSISECGDASVRKEVTVEQCTAVFGLFFFFFLPLTTPEHTISDNKDLWASSRATISRGDEHIHTRFELKAFTQKKN